MFSCRHTKWSLAGALISMGVLAVATNAYAANSAKSFFTGKTVRLVVGYGPGGGYDTYARMLAPYLSKQLGTTVVVENQPGAGGLTALNGTYAAKPDGLRIMLINATGAAFNQIIETSSVRFDLAKVGILGTVASSARVWLVRPGFEPMSPKALIKSHKLIRWGGSGVGDSLTDGAAMTCHTLKLNCKIVIGYKGSHGVAGALARGEVDAMYITSTSGYHYVKAKDAVPLVIVAPERSRFFPNVKTIYQELKLTHDQKSWLDFRATLDGLGRILVVPPGLPKARLLFMQAAVKKVLTDPKVAAQGEKIRHYIKFVDAQKTRANVLKVVSGISKKRKDEIKRIVLKDYR